MNFGSGIFGMLMLRIRALGPCEVMIGIGGGIMDDCVSSRSSCDGFLLRSIFGSFKLKAMLPSGVNLIFQG
ncbi:MAG: hypothetical protein ACM3SV_14755 [Betaproteobacteria bacterium]